MRLKVWFRLTWSDHRLSWDPGAYNNISTIWFNPNAGVDLEIWTPDLNIYNSRSSISTSFGSCTSAAEKNSFIIAGVMVSPEP